MVQHEFLGTGKHAFGQSAYFCFPAQKQIVRQQTVKRVVWCMSYFAIYRQLHIVFFFFFSVWTGIMSLV